MRHTHTPSGQLRHQSFLTGTANRPNSSADEETVMTPTLSGTLSTSGKLVPTNGVESATASGTDSLHASEIVSTATAAASTVTFAPGTVTYTVPEITGDTVVNDGTILAAVSQSTVDPLQLVNNSLIIVQADNSLLIAAPITSDFAAPSAPVLATLEASGAAYTTTGLLGSDTSGPITWTGTAAETGSQDWFAYSGSMASEILKETYGGTQASADFSNSTLEALGAPNRAVGLAVGSADPGNPTAGLPSTDSISYGFSSALPSSTSFFLWDPGAGYNSAGPYSFTFSASLDGVPVSTAGWSFQVEYPFNIASSTDYTIDAQTGTITVNNYSGYPLPDAVIVATPNAPVDAVSVTASTIAYDFWGLAFAQAGPQIQVQGGATLELGAAVDASQTVDLGASSVLELDQPTSFAGTIADFFLGDTIELKSSSSAGYYFDGFDNATNVMTVGEASGASFDLQFALGENYASADFDFTSDSSGNMMITTDAVPCYCRGTMILTDRGEVAVEALRIGDYLMTQGGTSRPLRWIGTRSYAGRFAAGNRTVLPVLIARNAIADNVPHRDLMVSPLHAMFLDGVLVPAAALVNGASIRQLSAMDEIAYYHLELDSHDLIVAEGAWSESFVDDDSRTMFHNVAEYRALHPDAASGPAIYCAPRIEAGPVLETIRRRLVARVTSKSDRRHLAARRLRA